MPGRVVLVLVEALTGVRARVDELTTRTAEQLGAHHDAQILTSLPRLGSVRAATPLAETGNYRARFPDRESPACFTATPSTCGSGRHRTASVSWTSNSKPGPAPWDFAGNSWQASTSAESRYRQLRSSRNRDPHATRILASTRTHVTSRCSRDH